MPRPQQPPFIYRVAVPSPLRRAFDYLPRDHEHNAPRPGMRVSVPFGRRQLTGVVLGTDTRSDVAHSKLRPISQVLDSEPLFGPGLMELLQWAADYYQHPPGEVFSTALPVLLRQGRPLVETAAWWRSCSNPDTARRALARAPRQLALYELILENDGCDRDTLLTHGYQRELLRQLENRELIVCEQRPEADTEFFNTESLTRAPSTATPHTLMPEQRRAVASVSEGLDKYQCYLLDGITGSGKTEVYIRIMATVLAGGGQCLVLVPEIGLTPQTISRFEARFNCPIVTLHSGLSDTERLAAWKAARSGTAGIVIGTRSAVFTPLAKPGLIIVDEEHDQSFKQQDGFRYSARDLAVMRGRLESLPVLLGSATPSLESLHNARTGKFTHLRLDARAGGASPAAMQIIDTARQGMEVVFSELALLRIEQQLKAGNQVLTFINRRGFAPLLQCQTCGWVAECDDCMAQFTLHAQPRALRCHHCGRRQPVPQGCPGCGDRALSTLGQGTQKIEALLIARFPDYPVLRIDRDSTRSRRRFDAMLTQIHSGEPCLLLGTQMLAKGHHFPNITLVVVLDADSGLFSADFRGQEHMAQTIVQVAGRAGRAERPGEVLIQSRHAAHSVLQRLVSLSYRAFALELLTQRQEAAMPPFTHLALLRAEAPAADTALGFLDKICELLARQAGDAVEWLGPLPAPMEKRAGRFRAQLLLKSASRGALQQRLTELLQAIEALRCPPRLRWSLDVDPLDLI